MRLHLRSIAWLCALTLSACGDDEGSADTSGDDDSSTSDGGTTLTTTTTNATMTDPTVADSSDSSGTPTATDSSSEASSSDDSSADGSSSDGSSSDGSSSETSTNDTGMVTCADCGPNAYCDWPDDQCGAGQDPACEPLPQVCPEIFAPVCGCDGETYGNDCEAAAAGVDVDYLGECEAAPGCACGPGEYCDWPDDGCGDGEAGECVLLPDACDDVLDPVCGCDGETYDNECFAALAGIDVAFAGECELAACDCEVGQYCALDPGMCEVDGGVCMIVPDICTDEFDPVCGCNGQTYSNACQAAAAGQNVEHDGAC